MPDREKRREAPQVAGQQPEPALQSAEDALRRARERLDEMATHYFGAGDGALERARASYYDALSLHADAEERLSMERLRRRAARLRR